MAKFRTLRFASAVSFFLVAACCSRVAAAKSRSSRNIYRLGISPIPDDRNGNQRGTAEAWVETFSLTKQKRQNNLKDDHRGQKPRRLLSKQAFASSIAFLTGAADVFSHRMNKCYANTMTGNMVKMTTAIGELRIMDALHFASVLFCYALGCTVYRSMVHFHTLEQNPKPHAAARSTTSPLILAMFAWSDFLFYTKSGMGTNGLVHVAPLALGFGLLNAASTDALGGTITFAMTGHVSKLSQGLSDWLFAVDPRKRRWRSATKLSARILGCFLMGILCATWLSTAGSNHILLQASGMTMPSFLVGENNLPLFTIVGVVAITLMQLYDRPLPNVLWDLLSLLNTKSGDRRRESNTVDTSINLWSQRAN